MTAQCLTQPPVITKWPFPSVDTQVACKPALGIAGDPKSPGGCGGYAHHHDAIWGALCSLTQLRHTAAQALDMLAGLEATPVTGGGFTFRHRDTGLAFAIGPAPAALPDDDSDAEGSTAEPELAFQPISLGSASEVRRRLAVLALKLCWFSMRVSKE